MSSYGKSMVPYVGGKSDGSLFGKQNTPKDGLVFYMIKGRIL